LNLGQNGRRTISEKNETHQELTMAMREITPAATWLDEPSRFFCSEITRIDFGGPYEEALQLVGGNPPSAMPQPLPRKQRRH
jgi:hypothetical protein